MSTLNVFVQGSSLGTAERSNFRVLQFRQRIPALRVYFDCWIVVLAGTWILGTGLSEPVRAGSESWSLMIAIPGKEVAPSVVQSWFDFIWDKTENYNFQGQGYFIFVVIFFFPSYCSSICSLCWGFRRRPGLDFCCWLFKQEAL